MVRRLCIALLVVCSACGMALAVPVRSLSTDGSSIMVNGRPTVLVGDSVTQGWMEQGADFQWKRYLDALARHGCNAAMLWAYIGVTDQQGDPRIGYDAPEIWPWVRVGGAFDLSKPNEAYFARLGEFARYARDRGIVVILTVHDGWTKTRFAGHPFNEALGGPLRRREQYVVLSDYGREMPETYDPTWGWEARNQFYQELFCRRLIEATSKYGNVIYEIMNEGEWYDPQRLDRYEAHFVRFFRSRTRCLTMVNERPRLRSLPGLDVYSLHRPNWGAETNAVDSFRLYSREAGARPLFFSEPVPEYVGDGRMETGLMRVMWGTALAGAGFVAQNDCSFGFAPRSTMASKANRREAVYALEGACARFMSSIDLRGVRPSGDLSSSGVCLAALGREYAVYAQSRRLTVDLRAMVGGAEYRVYDPRTGSASAWQACEGGTIVPFDTGTDEDRVIHIRRSAR